MHYWVEMDQIENKNSIHVAHAICFIKKQPPGVFYEKGSMFLKISQISQESTSVGVAF